VVDWKVKFFVVLAIRVLCSSTIIIKITVSVLVPVLVLEP